MSPALPASPAYDKLIALLRELFQLDQPDLDFGLYRVLHTRAAEINKFLSHDLLPQVRREFAHYQPASKAAMQQELDQAIAQATSLGADPDTLPKVQGLRQRLATEAVDLGGLEREVFDHLYQFFRRYYAEGDFLARRVYKEGTYAIPYEGEEVKLHWANRDQYYIKTSEYLRDYAFRLGSYVYPATQRPSDPATQRPSDPATQRPSDPAARVHFRLAEATEGEHGNVKAAEGKDRVFLLREGAETYDLTANRQELTFFFEYRPATLADRPASLAAADKKPKPPTQKELLQAAQERIEALGTTDAALAPWLAALAQPYVRADGTASGKTRLQVHLERYTARNTFDYFIHKDLGGFLRRELDFYLKNEVLHLDNIEQDSAPRVEQFLSKLRVLRKVAGHLIDFLAQLEDFQRKLWLKKKLVVDTQWCLTLDQVPAALLPAVAANEAQRQEWVALFGIEALASDAATPGYSVPLTVAFLQAYPNLVLDTRHFPADFTERLLASLDGNLDELTDGLLIHGENFQALNLLQERYREQVDCVYIDPPYNTGDDDFVYKDNYQSSSWMSLMEQTTLLSHSLLSARGSFFASCDENEFLNFGNILQGVYGNENYAETIVWNKRIPKNDKGVGNVHEYIHLFSKNTLARKQSELSYKMPKEGIEEIYEIVAKAKKAKITTIQARVELKAFYKKQAYDRGITLYNELDPNFEIWGKINMSWPNPKTDGPRYEVINPVTKRPVPIPKNGWRWKEETFRLAEKDGPEYFLPDGSLVRGRIWYSADIKTQPSSITYLREVEDFLLRSILSLKSDGSLELENLGLNGLVSYPKPSTLLDRVIYAASSTDSILLDYFAGSGTTGHAIINLNRTDGGKRKFILVEVGNYFGTATLPRLKKVTYTPEWKDGRPRRQPTAEETARGPKLLKVIRLESYEDTLNNLVLKRPEPVQTTLFPAADTPAIAAARQDYVLRYLLDVESRGSRSLLDVPAFRDPTAYTLDVKAPSSDHTETQAVDLLETFNYLLGLRVRQVGASQTLVANFEHADHVLPGDGAGRLRLKGTLRRAATGPWWVRPVTGTLADGRRVLIIWRRLTADAAQDNLVLNAWFEKHDYSVRDTEFDLIYVNGDNNLENLRQPDDTWKVQLIEDAFHRLLFAE